MAGFIPFFPIRYRFGFKFRAGDDARGLRFVSLLMENDWTVRSDPRPDRAAPVLCGC